MTIAAHWTASAPRRAAVLAATLLALGVALAACGDDGPESSVFQVEVGDCFDSPALAGETDLQEIETVEVVPCAEPHQFELYHEIEMEGDEDAPFPGSAAIDEAVGGCVEEPFTEFIGEAYYEDDVPFDVTALFPIERSWELGDRVISCIVYPLDGEPRRSSARGGGAG